MWISWRKEIHNALPDEGDTPEHSSYLAVPEGKFPRDMATEEIQTNSRKSGRPRLKRF